MYLSHRHDEALCSRLWQDVLRTLAGSSGSIDDAVSPLLAAQERGELPGYLRADEGDFDDVVGDLLAGALTRSVNASEVDVLRQIMRSPGLSQNCATICNSDLTSIMTESFVSEASFKGLVQSLVSALNLHFPTIWADAATSLSVFSISWGLLEALSKCHLAVLQATEGSTALSAEVLIFAKLLPSLRKVNPQDVAAAAQLWQTWLREATDDVRSATVALVKHRLQEMVLDCSSLARCVRL